MVESPLGAAVTVRLTVVSLSNAPLTALIVMVDVPVCVPPLVTIVRTELADPLGAGVIADGDQPVPDAT